MISSKNQNNIPNLFDNEEHCTIDINLALMEPQGISRNNTDYEDYIQIIEKPNENEESNFWFLNDINALIEEKQEDKEGNDKINFAYTSKGSGETSYTNHSHLSCANFLDDENENSLIDNDKDCLNKETENDENVTKDIDELIITRIVSQAKEQLSCRDLQETIVSNTKLASKYFNELLKSKEVLMELIIHPYGNYFIQIVVKVINDEQRIIFLQTIQNNFLDISINFYGTRVMQNLIYSINSDILIHLLVKICSNHITDMVTNINSSHIIFNLLSLNNKFIKQELFDQVDVNLMSIAMNKHGSCFIQRIIQNEPFMSDKIINNLIKNCIVLLTNQFGHYTIRYIFTISNPYYNFKLINLIVPHFLELANQRFSSTVLENCFEFCDNTSKNILYNTIANYSVMQELLVNQFGNYVLQKAIDSACPTTQKYLLTLLAPTMFALKRDSFGKQLFSKICTKYPFVKATVNAMKGKKKVSKK